MAVQTTSNLTNSITTVYKSKYLSGAKGMRLYDQLAVPYTELGADGKSMDELKRGSSISVPFLGEMNPGTTAISQTTDITPQTVRDATASVSPTSRGEALMWSENLSIQTYTDYVGAAYEKVGSNAMESIDLLAQAAALQGTWVERGAARASLDAGTVAHRASDSIFRKYDGMMQMMRIPGYVSDEGGQVWSAIMHPFVFHDISESGNVEAIGDLAQPGIHLNWELGQIGRFRLLVSPYAKVFGAAGADNGSATIADTINAAVNQLATSFTTTTDNTSNISYGLFWWLGTEETASTHYATNEPVKVLSATSVSTTYTLTVMGQAANGGLRFDHASGTAIRNADSVYPVVFGGPQSLVKVFATEVGEYGKTVGPITDGRLEQFTSLGWKYYGNYGLIGQNRILRFECSTSYEA